MSVNSRRKGNRRELELAKLLPGAVKASRLGYPGPDVEWRGVLIEVKARKDGFARLYDWLKDADMVAVRGDRKPWLLVCRIDTLLALLEAPAETPADVLDKAASTVFDTFPHTEELSCTICDGTWGVLVWMHGELVHEQCAPNEWAKE